jgi:hypothetical protein
MTLVQTTIGNAMYYTDNVNFFKFHIVSNPRDGLVPFACIDLGIPIKPSFTPEESAKIFNLVGTGAQPKTQYLKLKNGQAEPMPFHASGAANVQQGDVILRKVEASSVPGLFRHSCGSYSLSASVCSVCQKPFP